MTREEARVIAAEDWLAMGRIMPTEVTTRGYLRDGMDMVKRERELIRQRLRRLAKQKQRIKP